MRYSSHSREPHEYLQVALIFFNIFQHPERIYLFGGNGETPDAFCWEAQNASGRQAEIRTLPDVFFTEK